MTAPLSSPPRAREILAFWSPLASTWLMMSVEGPFLAAVIARLAEPKVNLAAYGIAFAVALIVEAPVIMMLSAATALVADSRSFTRLRRFNATLIVLVTLGLAVLLLPPVFSLWAERAIGLPPEVAATSWTALFVLLPWPGAIGYRRLYQGVMIRRGATRRVAYGTVVRLVTMAAVAIAAAASGHVAGAVTGALALSAGVSAEAIASRVMAAGSVRSVLAEPHRGRAPGYGEIVRFYVPLALTSLIGLALHPVTTFFMGQAPFPLESLAVLPVVTSLTFIFRSLGLAYQDAAIAFLARGPASHAPVLRFGAGLAAAASAGMALIAFTPLADTWFRAVSGLSAELTAFALPPARILALIPALSVVLSLQRAILVHGRATRPVTTATALEMAVLVAVLVGAVAHGALAGATAAALAFVLGRLVANAWLVPPCRAVLCRRD